MPRFDQGSMNPTDVQIESPGDMLASSSVGTMAPGRIEPGALRGYNPYRGLPSTLDAGTLTRIYELPDEPEHLFSEEASHRRRSWSENLSFCTGLGYLSGMTIGSGYGIATSLSSRSGNAPESRKLFANRLLNAATNRGNRYASNVGVLGLFFASSESLIAYCREADDVLNATAAGATAAALFKSAQGPRAMMVYGSLGAVGFTALSGVVSLLGR